MSLKRLFYVITQIILFLSKKLTYLAREHRKNSTLAEVLLWNKLKGRQILNYKFRRQIPIGNYIVDFYCKELQLVIEVDGISHDYKIEYDRNRQCKLEKLGIFILRFNDVEIKQSIDCVVQQIVEGIHICKKNHPPLPRPSGE